MSGKYVPYDHRYKLHGLWIDPLHITGLARVPILGLVIKTMKTASAPKNLFTVHAVVTVAPLVCPFFTKLGPVC
jgi:hypothetical protein